MTTIKTVLIDDERNILEMLEWQLQTHCPHVIPVALCTNADDGIAAIQEHKPQLVFLDIEMPIKNGFEVLLAFPDPAFEVIFTTAHNQFAVKAFRLAALDYLLKPIDATDLRASIERFEKHHQQRYFNHHLNLLFKQYQLPRSLPDKIPLASHEGVIFADPQRIIHCDAASNYTIIHFEDKTRLVVTKTLKEMEDLMLPYNFVRVHHSHIINPKFVARYIKSDGGYIEMNNGAQIAISRTRKERIVEMLMGKP